MKSIFPSLPACSRSFAAILLAAMLAGCGNKGPLVPPKTSLAAIVMSSNAAADRAARLSYSADVFSPC